jgi:HD-GYP domain-containing protein (c-di-GMP phosphodiesterase class II)
MYDMFCYTEGKYIKIKSAEHAFSEKKIKDGYFPDKLFIKMEDRVNSIRDKQRLLNQELKNCIQIDVQKAKGTIVRIVNNLLEEPKTPVLNELQETVSIIVDEFLEKPEIVEQLTHVALHDYSTSLHLTNCMLLCIGYALNFGLTEKEVKKFGIIGLMHDIGKREIPDYILQSSRKLSDEEFERIKKHPVDSRRLLVDANFPKDVIQVAHEHHERMDGSGYPKGKMGDQLNPYSKIFAIIDVYEALTHWRPYKEAYSPMKALKIIKKDVDNGKLDKKSFVQFTQSIVGIKK